LGYRFDFLHRGNARTGTAKRAKVNEQAVLQTVQLYAALLVISVCSWLTSDSAAAVGLIFFIFASASAFQCLVGEAVAAVKGRVRFACRIRLGWRQTPN
jgi:hypothetical protein